MRSRYAEMLDMTRTCVAHYAHVLKPYAEPRKHHVEVELSEDRYGCGRPVPVHVGRKPGDVPEVACDADDAARGAARGDPGLRVRPADRRGSHGSELLVRPEALEAAEGLRREAGRGH